MRLPSLMMICPLWFDLKAELTENPNRVLMRNSGQLRHRLCRGQLDFTDVCSSPAVGVFGKIQLFAHLDVITNRSPNILQRLGLTSSLRPTSRQRRTTDGEAFFGLNQNDAVLHRASLAAGGENVYALAQRWR